MVVTKSIEKSGGCVIDSAKAIAFGVKLPSSEDVWHNSYMKAEYSIREALSLGVVLTIPSAGSESSLGSVITDAEYGFMRAVNNGTIVSKFVVIDPRTSSASWQRTPLSGSKPPRLIKNGQPWGNLIHSEYPG